MLIAQGTNGKGGKLVFIGITPENVEKLLDGKPIINDRIPGLTLVVHYGPTLEAITREMIAIGLADETTIVREHRGR